LAVNNSPSDPVVAALARVIVEAIEANRRLMVWAVESGETPVLGCGCRARVGDCGCVCRVEPALPRAFMIRAAARIKAGRYPGYLRQRRCLLCLGGDHDLVEMIPVKIVAPDGRMGSKMVPGWRHRSKKFELDRAARAHAYPPGTREEQRRAAGLVPDHRH
jgi:hypothetical protein